MSLARKLLLTPLAALVLALACASAARADTITFNPLEVAGTGVTSMNSYTEAGFTFTSVGFPNDRDAFASAQQGNTNSYAGSAGLAPYIIGDSARLSHGGTRFSLNSIGLSRLFRSGQAAITVTFTGHFVGGGTTVQSFTFSQFGFQTFSFNSTFINLDHVDFGPQGASAFQFDNVVVNAPAAVPEPATMILLGTGLTGVAAKVRRRRQARQ